MHLQKLLSDRECQDAMNRLMAGLDNSTLRQYVKLRWEADNARIAADLAQLQLEQHAWDHLGEERPALPMAAPRFRLS